MINNYELGKCGLVEFGSPVQQHMLFSFEFGSPEINHRKKQKHFVSSMSLEALKSTEGRNSNILYRD